MSGRMIRSMIVALVLAAGMLMSNPGCDTTHTDAGQQEFRMVPIPYGQPAAKSKQASESGPVLAPSPYYCFVSTLTPSSAPRAYRYGVYYVYFPEGVLRQARRAGSEDVWTSFSFGSASAAARTEADALGRAGLVRMARCKLPGTQKAQKMVRKQLRRFGSHSWVFQQGNNEKKTSGPDGGVPPGVQGDWEWTCTEYFVTEVCYLDSQSGQLYNCQITDVRCISYELEYNGDGGGGSGGGWDDPGDPGGGGIPPDGGSDGDPCTQDSQQDGIPVECYNEPDPCREHPPGDPERPAYCDVPCNTGDTMVDSKATQLAMEEHWLDSYGTDDAPLPDNQRNEKLVLITEEGGNYVFTNIPPDEVSSCHFSVSSVSMPSNAVGLLHTHPYGDGETINDQRCLDHNNWDVEEHNGQYPTYDANDVSNADEEMVTLTGLPVYVIDKDKIRVITSSQPGQYADTFNRCGY